MRSALARLNKHLGVAALWLAAAAGAWADGGAHDGSSHGGGLSLWRTADQRAESALRAGDAAGAARTYTDPRRKAYAHLRAGEDIAAAQLYERLAAPESAYNRGNALARAGDLPGAMQAYDEALAQNPSDRDAQRNRALVAQAIAQRPSQGGQGVNPSGEAGGPGAAPTPVATADGRGQAPANRNLQADERSDIAAGSARSGTRAPPSNDRADDTPTTQRDADSARADVAAAASAAERPEQTPGGRNAAPAARSERQLAEDQWLRRLPDDPSGLLRRKFLTQYQSRLGPPK